MPAKGIESEQWTSKRSASQEDTSNQETAQKSSKRPKAAAPEEKPNGPKARFETQTALFDLTEEKHGAILEDMTKKLNRKRVRAEVKAEEDDTHAKIIKVRRAYNLMSRNSDTHMLAINLEKPQIRQLSSKFNGKRITEHWGHKTPSGLEFDSVEYHADGGDKPDKRLKEHQLLAENDNEWLAEQRMKAKQTGNGSRDKLIAFDCNISVATFNVIQQKEHLKKGIKHPREHYLTWNKDYIKFLETTFPGGIYRIAMPSEVMFKHPWCGRCTG